MHLTRRSLAKGLGRSAGAAALARLAPRLASAQAALAASTTLPDRTQFRTGQFETCLNNARWHPMSNGSRQAVERYLEYKQRGIWAPPDEVSAEQRSVKENFAKLIGADAAEVAYVTSTTTGETLFASALGFPDQAKGNIVTDALHFEGSLYLYDALKRQGVDVRVAPVKDWAVSTEDLARLIDKNTRLVAVSHVSFINGHQHDLKTLCDVAHAHGAVVYADAVQSAGVVPIDVNALGVDALGSATYKWLMGDMGIGFLYVRRDVLGRLRRPLLGYRQLAEFSYHAFPWDQPGNFPVDWKQRDDAAGYFEIGTFDNAGIAALSFSLPWLLDIGIANVQAHANRLTASLRTRVPALGFPCITPPDSRAAVISFGVKDTKVLAARLKVASVDVSLSPGRMRVSPSLYNDETDLEKLYTALAAEG